MNSSEERGRRPEPLGPGPGGNFRSAIFRAAGYFGFWLVLTDADSADVAAGLVAAVAATWASLRLMPAERWNLRPVELARFILHFLRQSIVAGTDVALRALDPRLPLQPGFVIYHTRLPPGPKRSMFCAIMSLLPGTLPCGARRRRASHSLSGCDTAGGRAVDRGGGPVPAGARRSAA